ncbi:MAG TPA: arginine deiminase-related protein [Fimbriimonadales bacterium]|nr:arginine deiminase-related protein [Fimbriimonadales bacterium]
MQPIADTIVMVTPDHFGFNPQTSETNVFQNQPRAGETPFHIREDAYREFTKMVERLQENGIRIVLLSSPKVSTPDAVFPNNWFTTYGGKLVLYPMHSPNRSAERQPETLIEALKSIGFDYTNHVIDLTHWEKENCALEGTGSLVFAADDTVSVFVALSPRSSLKVIEELKRHFPYDFHTFTTVSIKGLPIYHTNMLMSVGERYAVVCFDAISEEYRKNIRDELEKLNKEILEVSMEQMLTFCCNISELQNIKGERMLVMSKRAWNGFTDEQIERLERYGTIIPIDVETIERIGGGSVRCMIAEVFPPLKARVDKT